MELGQTRNLSDPFFARRNIVNKSAAKDVERTMNKFKMASIAISTAPVQTTGYSFWKKNEPKDQFVNLLDDDSLNPDDVVNCPICRNEFRKFSISSKVKKEKCLICGRIVCSNCNSQSLAIKAMDGTERDLKMCTNCHHSITKENKRLQLKQFFTLSLKSSFTTFYEGAFLLACVVQRDLPKFKYILSYPLTPSSLKKAKELDESLGQTLLDFEKEIKNLVHFQVNTKKQQQLKDAIKMYFITALSGTGPEYKLLHKQLETLATQPLAPDDSIAVTSPVLRSASIPSLSTTPPKLSSSPSITSKREKRQTILGAKLSSFTSLFSHDHAKPSNPEEAPYISGVNPLLSPLKGGIHITILGERFDPDCGVEIGGVECPVIERKYGFLVVESPPQAYAEPKDVCVYNSNGERCVMSQILFYAEDDLFINETPSVVEDPFYDYNSSNNGKKEPVSSAPSTNGKHNFITSPSYPPSSSSSLSTPASGAKSSSSSSSSFSGSKGHTRTPSRTEADEELSVNMINPVVSPLQGTKILMELNKVLPPGSSVKVGGKLVNIHPSYNNPQEISFISPPLSSGSKVIQITLPSGKITNLDGLLIYEELMPQTHFYSSSETRSAATPSYSSSYGSSSSASSGSGRVWGKRG